MRRVPDEPWFDDLARFLGPAYLRKPSRPTRVLDNERGSGNMGG
jgi:hypothetical protein